MTPNANHIVNLFLGVFMMFLSDPLVAQHQYRIDSLQTLLATVDDEQDRMEVLSELAKSLRTFDNDAAIRYGMDALAIAKNLGKKREQADILITIGRSYLNQDKYPETLENLTKALEFSIDLKYLRGEMIAQMGIGHLYYGQNDYPKAVNRYYEVLLIAEKIADSAYIKSANRMINSILAPSENKTAEALTLEAEKYKDVLRRGAAIEDTQVAYQHLAGIYYWLNMDEESIKHGKLSLELARQVGGANEITNALDIIADTYLRQGNFKDALPHLTECLTLSTKKELKQMEMRAAEKIGITYYQMGDFEKAKQNFERALNIAYEVNKLKGLQSAHYQLSQVDLIQGNFESSLENFKKHILYRDSIFNTETTKRILREEFRYKTDKTLAEQQAQREKNNLRMISIGVISFLLILYFYDRWKNGVQGKKLKTQVKEQTQEIRKQKEKLEEMAQLKTRLYTNITHEFRTPLTIISGLVDQLEIANETKEPILRNSEELLNLVNQMLELRKLEAGSATFNYKLSDIIPLMRYLTESFSSYAKMKGVELHFLCDEDRLVMDFDEEKITRIYSNLVSNAIKFTPEGGDIYIQLQRRALNEHLSSLPEDGQNQSEDSEGVLILKVKDTGVGIPQKKLPHIFERFYQGDNSSTRREEGTGIGLTLVSELVRSLKGDISVKSTTGEGSTFTVTLPISNTAPSEHQPDLSKVPGYIRSPSAKLSSEVQEVTEIAGTQSPLPTVLVVEDNPDVIHYLIKCLHDHYALEIAMNGQEGIDKAIHLIPDLIVSDVMMPVKDGLALCATVKEDIRTNHIPVVLLTAKADFDSKLEGLVQGADAYLGKPFHQEELLVTLKNLLLQRLKIQEHFQNFHPNQSPSSTSPVSKKQIAIEDEFLKRIRLFIEEDLSNAEISMLEIMRELSMSRSQIYKKVKALTGVSPSRYIRSLRLHHAMRLLKTSDLNVSEVAYEVGFTSPVYFSDMFLEEFGFRPKETDK